MGRRSFSREFKLEAVRLVRERGVSVAQAARDLDLHQNMLRNWVRDFAADPAQQGAKMRRKAHSTDLLSEEIVKDIRRATRKPWGLAVSQSRA